MRRGTHALETLLAAHLWSRRSLSATNFLSPMRGCAYVYSVARRLPRPCGLRSASATANRCAMPPLRRSSCTQALRSGARCPQQLPVHLMCMDRKDLTLPRCSHDQLQASFNLIASKKQADANALLVCGAAWAHPSEWPVT